MIIKKKFMDVLTQAYAHLDIGSSKLETASCMTNRLLGMGKENPVLAIESASTRNSVAEEVGFEPTWDCSQTDFESAPL